jgi:hypothetical protein
MLKIILRKKKWNNNKPQHKSNHKLQQVADYQPGDHLKEGTHITYIHLFVSPVKGVKKSKAPCINKDSSALPVLFSQKFFICWWNRPM